MIITLTYDPSTRHGSFHIEFGPLDKTFHSEEEYLTWVKENHPANLKWFAKWGCEAMANPRIPIHRDLRS